ncbi:MAG: phosphopentomutase [candidate division Zixibacteria bacterium]|nr:phosphopentomutase [candidate division Zixibacteria bacterium]
MRFNRVCLLVLDACGVGELPDAEAYGDAGSNTLGHCAEAVGGLKMPTMGRMGLGNIIPIRGISETSSPKAYYGKLAEQSAGKDSTIGHWELAGLISHKPFPVYPNGFPKEIIDEFVRKTGRPVIGNEAASGTEIIARLGETHLKTGSLIVYTSADSVFQVAAHVDLIPLSELYRYCRLAREMLQGEHGVSRVIARPFAGKPGEFYRTPDRKDFSLPPTGPTVLDLLSESSHDVITVGKVDDLFAGRGVTKSQHTKSNQEGIERIIDFLKTEFHGLLFANLVDFDMIWGHRNDAAGFAGGLEYFDSRLPEILAVLRKDDLFIITADHGCDPTTTSTDHSREYTPLLAYSPGFQSLSGKNLGIRRTFADIGATISEIFGLTGLMAGDSFLKELK